MVRKRILVAENPARINEVCEALSSYELLRATKLYEAERLLMEDGIDLFVVGVHFDESQALELVKFIRSNKEHKKSPIVVIRSYQSEHENILRQALGVMKMTDAITEYLECQGHCDDLTELKAALSATVERLVPSSVEAER